MGRGVRSGRGRPKGSKNKRPYPLTHEQVVERNKTAVAAAHAAIQARGYIGTGTTYLAIHKAALKWMPLTKCDKEDETCSGRLEHAFRHDADPDLVRLDPDGRPFYVGPIEEGYIGLCASHHRRYDRRDQ